LAATPAAPWVQPSPPRTCPPCQLPFTVRHCGRACRAGCLPPVRLPAAWQGHSVPWHALNYACVPRAALQVCVIHIHRFHPPWAHLFKQSSPPLPPASVLTACCHSLSACFHPVHVPIMSIRRGILPNYPPLTPPPPASSGVPRAGAEQYFLAAVRCALPAGARPVIPRRRGAQECHPGDLAAATAEVGGTADMNPGSSMTESPDGHRLDAAQTTPVPHHLELASSTADFPVQLELGAAGAVGCPS